MHGERLRRRRLAPALLPRAPPHAEDGRRPRTEAREKLAPATAKGDSRRRRIIRGRHVITFRSERFHVGAFPPSATSNRASTGGGLHSRRVRPERPPSSHFRRPVAGRDRARRSRESGSAVFAGAVSSREIRQRIAPSGGIPTIPAPSAPMPWIATDRSKAATRSPSLSTRARTLLDASASTAANLTAAAVPSDASDVESPPTSPDASTSSRPRLPTSTAERKRAMLVDAMAKVGVTRPPPTLTTRRGDGKRSASSTPLGSDDDDTAKEDGDAPPPPPPPPLLPPPPPPPRPCPRRESRPGRRTILDRTRDEGNRRASGRRPEEDSRRDGFPRGRPGRRVSRFASFVQIVVVVVARLRRVFRRDGAATVQSASVRRGRE